MVMADQAAPEVLVRCKEAQQTLYALAAVLLGVLAGQLLLELADQAGVEGLRLQAHRAEAAVRLVIPALAARVVKTEQVATPALAAVAAVEEVQVYMVALAAGASASLVKAHLAQAI